MYLPFSARFSVQGVQEVQVGSGGVGGRWRWRVCGKVQRGPIRRREQPMPTLPLPLL